jgi:hypothetical protein
VVCPHGALVAVGRDENARVVDDVPHADRRPAGPVP